MIMQTKLTQHSHIQRFSGEFSSLAAFFLCPSAKEADSEDIRITAACHLDETAPHLSLAFEETEGVDVSLTLSESTLTITRCGQCMTFSEGRTMLFDMATTAGLLRTEAYTEKLLLQKRGTSCMLTLCYYACFSGVVQKNTLRFVFSC